MEFRRLKYFVALAEELHFGRAATRLDIAQPPLSRQIAALEADLGVQLIDRSRSQIRLTQAGEILETHARRLLDGVSVAYRETRQVGSGAAGRLRVGFVGSAGHGVLPALIRAFRADFPEIELNLQAMNNHDLQRALVQREIDIAIARELDDEEFRREPLTEEPLVLALPDNSELATGPIPRLTDLTESCFILYPRAPEPGYADRVLELCAKAGFTPAATEIATDFQSAISLVAVGVGIAVVPQSIAASPPPGVICRPYEGPNPGTRLSVHARLDNRAPQVMQFLDAARCHARRLRRDPPCAASGHQPLPRLAS